VCVQYAIKKEHNKLGRSKRTESPLFTKPDFFYDGLFVGYGKIYLLEKPC